MLFQKSGPKLCIHDIPFNVPINQSLVDIIDHYKTIDMISHLLLVRDSKIMSDNMAWTDLVMISGEIKLYVPVYDLRVLLKHYKIRIHVYVDHVDYMNGIKTSHFLVSKAELSVRKMINSIT